MLRGEECRCGIMIVLSFGDGYKKRKRKLGHTGLLLSKCVVAFKGAVSKDLLLTVLSRIRKNTVSASLESFPM